jgi:hypothetical protein
MEGSMAWIKVGSRIVNLDNVTKVDLFSDQVVVSFNYAEAEAPGYTTFRGDEAKALRTWFEQGCKALDDVLAWYDDHSRHGPR